MNNESFSAAAVDDEVDEKESNQLSTVDASLKVYTFLK